MTLLTGCGSEQRPAAATSSPPPEAMRPSPVDRDAEPAPVMFDWTHHIGVAGHDPRGRACLAVSDDSLAVGTPITIVWMADPQRASEARVTGKRARAWEIANTPLEGHSYDLEIIGGPPLSGEYGIGVVGAMKPAAAKGPLVHIDLDGDGEPETFRQCASAEGLHLTVWTGEPLQGPLDWQRYVYLGMDLEVTCTETETGQP